MNKLQVNYKIKSMTVKKKIILVKKNKKKHTTDIISKYMVDFNCHMFTKNFSPEQKLFFFLISN